ATAGSILGHYVQQNGGAARMSGGGGSGGTVGGSAGRAVAQRLGGFISAVGEVGLEEALRREGLADLVGRPLQEILAALLNRLGGPASSIDDVDARTALARLQEEILKGAQTPEDVEKILKEQALELDVVLRDYFGLYLFEQFCRVFFERLVQKRGESKALAFLDDIKEFIKASLVNHVGRRALSKIAWAGAEGAKLCSEIMHATLTVFVT
ncbi:MAG TPA: hypothetical protein VFY10_10475, partial [Dehalococcoidia bacterium]|nr:hypothetical protein [Dehalococcoidia bacterium]